MLCYDAFLPPTVITFAWFCDFMLQDFKNGKVDTAFIPKHEKELAAVRISNDFYLSLLTLTAIASLIFYSIV